MTKATSLKRKDLVEGSPYAANKMARMTASRKSTQSIRRIVKKTLTQVAEKKEADNSVSGFQMYNAGGLPNTTGSLMFLCNSVAEGTDWNQRVGLSIRHSYIQLSVSIVQTAGQDWGYYAIVLDRQPQGSLPVGSDIFDNANTPYNNLGYACRNTHLYPDRFQVIMHQDFKIGANAGGSEPWFMKHYVDLSKLKGRDAESRFSSTGSTIANINEGALYCFVSSGCNNNAGGASTVNVFTRYRFTDV